MKYIYLYITLLLLAVSGCNKDDSQKTDDIKEGQGGVIFTLMIESVSLIEDIHLYGFDNSGRLVVHKYYSSPALLTSDELFLDRGVYTFVKVLNVGINFVALSSRSTSDVLPSIMFSDFMTWLKVVEPRYTNMLVGMDQKEVLAGVVTDITIDVKDDIKSLKLNILRLEVVLPDEIMTDYNTLNASYDARDYDMQAMIEVYQKGSDLCVHRYSEIFDDPIIDLILQKGEYDILLWINYIPKESENNIKEHYYVTSSLDVVAFNKSKSYQPDVSSRDAFSLTFESVVSDIGVTKQLITLERPFAKYQIIATDVERYRLFERINNYPLLESLTMVVAYEGFFPSSFNVRSGKPNNAITGIEYNYAPYGITEKDAKIGGDFIFANREKSFVKVTITAVDSSGKKISQVSGVTIDYLNSHITTVKGDFLTSRISGEGLLVNPNWDGEINYEF